MSLRLARVRPPLDPVVRGWRPWPTDLMAPALRTLCVPSFVVALPRGRLQSTFLFVLVVVLLALHTALVLGPAMSAPAILKVGCLFFAEWHTHDHSDDGTPATVGAAITARSSQASSPAAFTRTDIDWCSLRFDSCADIRRGGVEQEAGCAIVASGPPTRRGFLSDDHPARHASADPVSEVVQRRETSAGGAGEIAAREGAQIERRKEDSR